MRDPLLAARQRHRDRPLGRPCRRQRARCGADDRKCSSSTRMPAKPKSKAKEKEKEGNDKEKGKVRSSGVVGSLFKAATGKSTRSRSLSDASEASISPEISEGNATEASSQRSSLRTSDKEVTDARNSRKKEKNVQGETGSMPVSPSGLSTETPSSPASPLTVLTYNTASGANSLREHGDSPGATPMVGIPRRGSKESRGYKALYASQSVEDFLVCGLLPVPGGSGDTSGRSGLLEVRHTEPIASVVEQLHQWRLRSCIVSFNASKKEFFDCMDLVCLILQEVNDADGCDYEDWEVMKSKLRRVADSPVSAALRPPRGSCEFRRFDSEESLQMLLQLICSVRRVPVYRKGELCRIVTASDILEMCCCVSEDTKGMLEKARLTDMLAKSPGMISTLSVSEEFSLLEVLQSLKDSGTQVVPVHESGSNRDSVTTTNSLATMLASKSESLQKDLTHGDGRALVGQFDVAFLKVMLVHPHEPKDGLWWWEDAAVNTKNIMTEPCMDFLALRGSVIPSSSVAVPYTTVQAEESLARAIGRILASAYQSVVVYPPNSRRDEENDSARTGTKRAISGIASTQSLVIAMFEGGFFQSLKFDPSKPRRVDSEDTPLSARSGGLQKASRNARKPPTLTNIQVGGIAAVPDLPSYRDPKVKFSNVIDLDYLCVPTCPDHGVRFMKFVQDEQAMFPLDFHGLMEVSDNGKVVGSTAQCLSCQRLLGRITGREKPLIARAATPPTSGFGSFGELVGSFGSVLDSVPFLKRTPSSPTAKPNPGAASPPGSALKAGTSFPLKKSKTAERLENIRAQEEARNGSQVSGSGFFFSRCCSPCRCLSDKESIAANVSVMRGGLPPEPDSPPAPKGSARSTTGSPSGSATPLLDRSAKSASSGGSSLQGSVPSSERNRSKDKRKS